MIKKEASPSAGKVLVTFEYPTAARAATVHLVGDFNKWDEEATPMQRDGRAGVWRVRLELEKGREYQFRYLVDGASWHNDWHSDRYVPNIHGSDNSVVST